jgi:hypothetical protein
MFILAAGTFVAVCPAINRPWAYDVNPSPVVGVTVAVASVMIAAALFIMAMRRSGTGGARVVRRSLRTGLLFLFLVALVAAVWGVSLESRVIAKRFGVVVPDLLYRSGQISTSMLEPTLAANGIDVIIDLNGVEADDLDQQYEIAAIERLGLEGHRFQLAGDGRGNIEQYVRAIKIIEDCRSRGRRVLIHCSAGTQRTGGVIAAYRLLVQQASMASVMHELRRYGWRPGNDAVLLTYLNEHLSTLARRLQEEGVLKQPPDRLPVFADAAAARRE